MTLDARTERLAHAVLDGRETASVEWLRATLGLALAALAEERENADRLAAMLSDFDRHDWQRFPERWLTGDRPCEVCQALAKHRERRAS